MASLRMIGHQSLLALMKIERGDLAPVDLGFLLYGGNDLTSDVAIELLKRASVERARRPWISRQ